MLPARQSRPLQRPARPLSGEKQSVSDYPEFGAGLRRGGLRKRTVPPGPVPGIHDSVEPRLPGSPAGLLKDPPFKPEDSGNHGLHRRPSVRGLEH